MTTRNPWLGLASYDVPKGMEEDYLFCGRDEETMDIVRLIDNNLFITLYGSSGIGKTSLLKAGVIPILKRKDYFPLYVRLSQESNEISYAEAIVKHLKSCGLTEESLVTMEHADGNDRLFLWNYFATTRFYNAEGREIYPVIILDQFEEVFRDADKAKAELLLQQIYLLLNDELEMPDAEGYSADTNYRFVASIREDYLFVLEDSIDELSLDLYKNNRYRLRPMKPENARQVILVPGRDCIEESEKEKVAEKALELAKKPQSDDIDTLLLSLVCAGTFDKKVGEKITFGDLSIWKDNPMQVYYQDAMKALNADQIRYIQQHLIREDGSRKRVSVETLKNVLGENDFQELTKGKNRLFSIGDKGQVELLHDKLAMAVYEERKAFEERERKKKLRRRVSVIGVLVLAVVGVFFFQNSKLKQQRWKMLESQSRLVAEKVVANASDDSYLARQVALEILPMDLNHPDRPYTPEAERALREANQYHSAIIRVKNNVGSACFSPDGKEIMTCSYDDSTFRFYDKTGGLVRSFKTGFYCYRSTYSSDNQRILSCFRGKYHGHGDHRLMLDSILMILDVNDGSIIKSIVVDNYMYHSVDFAPNGKRFITTSSHTIEIWDVETGALVKTIESERFYRKAKYSPDGKLIAAIDTRTENWLDEEEEHLVIFDAETYQEKQRQTIIGSSIHSIDFSQDGKKYLVSSTVLFGDGSIKIWSVEKGNLLAEIKTDDIYNVSFCPNGDKILSSSPWSYSTSSENNYKTIKIWDANSGEEIQTLYGHKDYVESVRFSPDGNEVVSASLDKTIRIWNLRQDDNSKVLVKSDTRLFEPVIDFRNNLIASSCADSTIRVWDLQSGKEILKLKKENGFGVVAINPNGEQLAYTSDMSLCFYDLKEGAIINSITDTTNYFHNITYGLDGKKMVFTTSKRQQDTIRLSDYKIKLLDLETDSIVWAIPQPDHWGSVEFSPNGKHILYGLPQPYVFDAVTGEEILVGSEKRSSFSKFATYSHDGKLIASLADDNSIRIWDAETGNCIKTLEGHENGVLCARFSPDGKYIVSGSKDKTVCVWELLSGVCVCTYKGHDASVVNVAFTSDGKHIISISDDSASDDSTIRLWDFPPLQELIDQTRERFKDRPLTPEERRMYYLE